MEHVPSYCQINGCKDEASWWIPVDDMFTETPLGEGDAKGTFYICSNHYGQVQNENGNYTHIRVDTGKIYDVTIGGTFVTTGAKSANNMPPCLACGHPGHDHYSGPQRERAKCTVRYSGRRCMCSQYIPNSDDRRPSNPLIGRLRKRT
jgi:hypothetical protein